jgi:3-oxoacyl-[acyl-carrier protein] reductase
MDLGLKNKIALVSGASKGIGRMIAEELAAEGAHLAICSRTKTELERVADGIRRRCKVRVLPVAADLSTARGVQSFVDQAMVYFHAIDILVNVAGAIRPGSLTTKPIEEWHEDWSLKVFGYIRMMQVVFPIMRSRGGGRIVNIIGTAGSEPDPSYLAGGAANAALMNITKALAMEGGPLAILVNGINPGPTRTDRWDNLNEHYAHEWGVSVDEAEKTRMLGNPLARPCEPCEIAALTVFLVSSRASYINGALINLDGGSIRSL